MLNSFFEVAYIPKYTTEQSSILAAVILKRLLDRSLPMGHLPAPDLPL